MPESLTEFNRRYSYECYLKQTQLSGTSTKASKIKSAVFYSVLCLAVVFSFLYSNGENAGKRFGSFAYNTVLTSSMKSVYPKGSLVTSWAIKPGDTLKAGLKGGDDIVFTKDKDGTVVVHRIIEIMEDYEDTGQRAFKTQGVDNPAPDTWITYEENVIGRVTWHVPLLGDALAFVQDNILFVMAGIVVLCLLITLFRFGFSKEPEKQLTMDS